MNEKYFSVSSRSRKLCFHLTKVFSPSTHKFTWEIFFFINCRSRCWYDSKIGSIWCVWGCGWKQGWCGRCINDRRSRNGIIISRALIEIWRCVIPWGWICSLIYIRWKSGCRQIQRRRCSHVEIWGWAVPIICCCSIDQWRAWCCVVPIRCCIFPVWSCRRIKGWSRWI